MALIDFKQIKHGQELMNAVDNAVEKTAIVTTPSEVPSDELIPSETYINSKLEEMQNNFPSKAESTLAVISSEPVTELTLPHTPTDDNVKLIINGIEYAEGADFTVERTTNKIIWTGEFPLNAYTVDNIKATYDYMQPTTARKKLHIMGMVLADEGVDDTPYRWVRVDKNFNTIDFDPEHGTWADIQAVTTGLDESMNDFIEIPTTWVKTENLQSGPYAGCNCWWIADGPAPGFHVHPAFIKPDGTPGKLRIATTFAVQPVLYDYKIHGWNVSTIYKNGKAYLADNVYYKDLRAHALTYNANGETGYRAYNIYDLGFLSRMALIENGDPNIQYVSSDSLDDGVYAVREWYFGATVVDRVPTDDAFHAAYDYHGIKSMCGDSYEMCLIDGLTTIDGTYQIIAPNGSGQMIETGVDCVNGGIWPINCKIDTVSGVNFGDIFINDGRGEVLDDSDKIWGGTLGSFCDFQYIVNDSYFFLTFEDTYAYSGLFALNSAPLGDEEYSEASSQMYYTASTASWRLVQVV